MKKFYIILGVVFVAGVVVYIFTNKDDREANTTANPEIPDSQTTGSQTQPNIMPGHTIIKNPAWDIWYEANYYVIRNERFGGPPPPKAPSKYVYADNGADVPPYKWPTA